LKIDRDVNFCWKFEAGTKDRFDVTGSQPLVYIPNPKRSGRINTGTQKPLNIIIVLMYRMVLLVIMVIITTVVVPMDVSIMCHLICIDLQRYYCK